MAHTLTEHYVYPPDYENMNADQKVGTKRACIHITGLCDGSTGELTDRIIVNLSDFRSTGGKTKSLRIAVDRIDYATAGTAVRLEWDRAENTTIALIPTDQTGFMDWYKYGGKVDPSDGLDDRTGDILLTTIGFGTSNDTYDITIHFRIKDSYPAPVDYGDE